MLRTIEKQSKIPREKIIKQRERTKKSIALSIEHQLHFKLLRTPAKQNKTQNNRQKQKHYKTKKKRKNIQIEIKSVP